MFLIFFKVECFFCIKKKFSLEKEKLGFCIFIFSFIDKWTRQELLRIGITTSKWRVMLDPMWFSNRRITEIAGNVMWDEKSTKELCSYLLKKNYFFMKIYSINNECFFSLQLPLFTTGLAIVLIKWSCWLHVHS